jgi:hypothetical protein
LTNDGVRVVLYAVVWRFATVKASLLATTLSDWSRGFPSAPRVRATDRRVVAGGEDALVAVIPADAIVDVRSLAQRFEDLAEALPVADAMT